MAPIEIDNAAPLVARVLHKLLDHDEFVQAAPSSRPRRTRCSRSSRRPGY